MEYRRCTGAVDIAVVRKDLQAPGFVRQERQHTGFNGGKVRNDEFVSFLRHECRAYEFREDFRHGVAETFFYIEAVCLLSAFTGGLQHE